MRALAKLMQRCLGLALYTRPNRFSRSTSSTPHKGRAQLLQDPMLSGVGASHRPRGTNTGDCSIIRRRIACNLDWSAVNTV